MLKLPVAYQDQMYKLLGPEAEAFLKSYEAPRTQGLRLNPLKAGLKDGAAPAVLQLEDKFSLEPVPWCSTGYYYDEASRPGKHPYHAAGLYYIQEPSAMSAVELLEPEPGELVLDLAAAPGGKSTHIAGKLQGEGLLIANEIHPVRARSLSENIERFGVRNAVVTNMAPQELADRFPRFFDKIMLDAPCSGEGMFRKDPEAIAEWSPEHVAMCTARQQDILRSTLAMLKPGGRLAYSTCTFNEQENERMIDWLLEQGARSRRGTDGTDLAPFAAREGHFVCVLRLADDTTSEKQRSVTKRAAGKGKRGGRPEEEAMRLFRTFAADTFGPDAFTLPSGEPVLFGEQLYWLPRPPEASFDAGSLEGLKVLRPGLHLGEVKKGRIEPSHALALAQPSVSAARRILDLASDDERTEHYLRGEVLAADWEENGWTLIGVDGYPLGWGKQTGNQVKNHYPKGLRRA